MKLSRLIAAFGSIDPSTASLAPAPASALAAWGFRPDLLPSLADLDPALSLDDAFAEVEALAAACRFRDCRHAGEPGCAVDAAIADGALDPARRDGRHKLERELAAAERRTPARQREDKARWKAIQKSLRARTKVDPKLGR